MASDDFLDDSKYIKDIPASKLKEYIQNLVDKRIDPHDPTLSGFDEEFGVRRSIRQSYV